MYSLYRAWFGGEETYPRLETLSPPDTLVRVGNEGEHQFVAHRSVLAAHSGYLKALLATTASNASPSGRGEHVTSVSVSSVGGEAFAPLLNYMYTGRLEVTLENIYSVLLATHLLHMPGALEQCRAALLRLRGPPLTPTTSTSTTLANHGTILRPVANRLGPPLCWSQPGLYPSAALSHLSNFQLTPGLSMIPTILQEPGSCTLSYSCNFRENTPASPAPRELGESPNPENRDTSPRVSSTPCRASVEDRAVNDEVINDEISVNNRSVDSSPTGSNDRALFTINEQTTINRRANAESPRAHEETEANTSNDVGTTGVVYDIACCDGPVRFHRVLNENYVPAGDPNTAGISSQQRPSCSSLDDDRSRDVVENDENGKPDGIVIHEEKRSGGGSTDSYTCGYCRHTFKSHYCYKKHARRHLLPSAVAVASASDVVPARTDARRREVRLLDLNVQYYPCKICGSKFPSYYFVHKHKKLCHASVEESNSSVANVAEGESSSGGGAGGVVVVVQGTNNPSDP